MEPRRSHLGPPRGPSPLPLSTTTVSNFLYSLFRNPDLTTSPASLLADDSTSYFVGKIELTREKFPRSPATNLRTSRHSRCSSQTTRHLAQADALVCLPPVKPLTAACSAAPPRPGSFHPSLFLFSSSLSRSPHSPSVFLLLTT